MDWFWSLTTIVFTGSSEGQQNGLEKVGLYRYLGDQIEWGVLKDESRYYLFVRVRRVKT